MLNIHVGSTEQGRSVDVGVDEDYARIVIGSPGRPGGSAFNDPLALGPLSILEADVLSRLLLAAVQTAKREIGVEEAPSTSPTS